MKIGIDCRMIYHSGIGTYLQNLLREFSYLSISEDMENILYGDVDKLKKYNFTIKEFNFPIYSLQEQLFSPLKLKKERLDLIHFPHYNVPLLYSGEIVVTIHDLIHLLFPQYFSFVASRYAHFMLRHVSRKAKKIITDSHSSKRDIIKLLKVSSKKITVIYPGVSRNYRPIKDEFLIEKIKRKYNITQEFILFVGLLKPHKNIINLIKAFFKLRKNNSLLKNKLVIIGKKKGPYYLKVEELIRKLGLEEEIIFLGKVDADDLLMLYNSARVFILPSFYEGFGLPPLEAMACGIPVITANTSSLPEVVGDAAVMVDPYDIEEMAKAMYTVFTDRNLRKQMIDKGFERVKYFSWENAACQTCKVYKEVYKGLGGKND